MATGNEPDASARDQSQRHSQSAADREAAPKRHSAISPCDRANVPPPNGVF